MEPLDINHKIDEREAKSNLFSRSSPLSPSVPVCPALAKQPAPFVTKTGAPAERTCVITGREGRGGGVVGAETCFPPNPTGLKFRIR